MESSTYELKIKHAYTYFIYHLRFLRKKPIPCVLATLVKAAKYRVGNIIVFNYSLLFSFIET